MGNLSGTEDECESCQYFVIVEFSPDNPRLATEDCKQLALARLKENFRVMQEEAEANETSEMTAEEIDEIISEVRNERR